MLTQIVLYRLRKIPKIILKIILESIDLNVRASLRPGIENVKM